MPSAVLLSILTFALFADAGERTGQPFSLAIAGPEGAVKGGSEVKVRVTLTNTSDHEITIFDTNRECDYQVEVRDVSGRPAPETEHQRGLRCGGTLVVNRNVLISLKPRESTHDEITVNDLYQMTRPGKYLVRVMRRVPKDLGEGTASSNVVIIDIEP